MLRVSRAQAKQQIEVQAAFGVEAEEKTAALGMKAREESAGHSQAEGSDLSWKSCPYMHEDDSESI